MYLDVNSNINELTKVLDVITQRQEMTIHNVANARTPGYKAKRVSFGEMLARVSNTSETPLAARMGTSIAMDETTGKPVNLEEELVEMQRDRLMYTLSTRTINKAFAALRTASQVGR